MPHKWEKSLFTSQGAMLKQLNYSPPWMLLGTNGPKRLCGQLSPAVSETSGIDSHSWTTIEVKEGLNAEALLLF